LDRKKGTRGIKNKINFRRRCIQAVSALLYNANLPGFADGTIYKGRSKGVCVPGLNCYSCPGAVASCPLGALQNALSNLPNKLPLYIIGFLLLAGAALGRVVCGFLCPFGLIQELLHKIPTPKLKKNRFTRGLSWLKYLILALFVVVLPVWYAFFKGLPVPAFCKYICPAGTLEGGFILLGMREEYRALAGMLFNWKAVLCVVILAGCIFIYRGFCRFLCPLGAIYSFFSRIALLAVRVDKDLCNECGLCVMACPMDIRRVGDHECIHCGHCISSCPKNAIYFGKERKKEINGSKETEGK